MSGGATGGAARGSRLTAALRSSIGTKVVMALTGVALLGFVVAHMLGNLQVFAGPRKLNDYAHALEALGPVLWAARIGLLAIFVLHVATAIRLTLANRAARGPTQYAVVTPSASTYASRTMIWSGVIVLAFVVYHLLHFTFGVVQPDSYAADPVYASAGGVIERDVYRMVVLGFRNPVVSLSYVVAQVLLGLHIAHGASSVFQTLGFTHPRLAPLKKWAGPALALAIVLGNCSIPIAVLLDLVEQP